MSMTTLFQTSYDAEDGNATDTGLDRLEGDGAVMGVTGAEGGQVGDIMTEQRWLQVVFVILYVIIFVVGLFGNSLVIFVVARKKAMQTITNTFITNLAISDVMMCLLAVPFTPASALLRSWTFGETLCHVVPMTLGVSVHVSTLTSTAIAIDRYLVIVHPLRARMMLVQCLLLTGAIWMTSLSISLPLAIYQKVSWVSTEDVYICHEHWSKPAARQFFTAASFVLQYIIPGAVISYCYTKVFRALRHRSRSVIMRTGNKPRDREVLDMRRKHRTNRMLIAMVAIFVCCWLPLNILHVAGDHVETTLYNTDYYMLAFLVAHVIAMSSTIYNPFLYAWMNENFKNEFKHVLPRLFTARCLSRRRSAGRTRRGASGAGCGVGTVGGPASMDASLDTFDNTCGGGWRGRGSGKDKEASSAPPCTPALFGTAPL